jgi:6-methylsalicylate decarboxylase
VIPRPRAPARIDRRTLLSWVGAAAASPGVLAAPLADAPRGPAAGLAQARSHRLIDVHAHFIPEDYRRALLAVGYDRAEGVFGIPAWSEAAQLGMMERLGIATAIVSISSPGVHFGDDAAARSLARKVNLEGAGLKSAHPGRFGFFASLPLPDVSGALRELGYALDELGADGVTIESNHRGVYPGDPAFEPVFAEFDRRQTVVFMHPTSPHCPCSAPPSVKVPVSVLEFMFETTRAVTNLVLSGTLDRYRRMRLIVPHAGAALPALADRIARAAARSAELPNLSPAAVFETLGRLYYDVAGTALPRQLPALRSFADPRHVFYGSDWPWTPESAVAQSLRKLEDEPEVSGWPKAQLWRENAARLFPGLSH